MLNAFIIEQLKREAEKQEQEEWQPVPLTLEISDRPFEERKEEKNERSRIKIRL